jgi:SAM domain (Sterile alpha motif)
MDVGNWLRNLGLGRYEALFRASDIDADILPELTDADLEKLGVARAPQASPQRHLQFDRRRNIGGALRIDRCEAARRRRAAAADGDVLRPGWLDGLEITAAVTSLETRGTERLAVSISLW